MSGDIPEPCPRCGSAYDEPCGYDNDYCRHRQRERADSPTDAQIDLMLARDDFLFGPGWLEEDEK